LIKCRAVGEFIANGGIQGENSEFKLMIR